MTACNDIRVIHLDFTAVLFSLKVLNYTLQCLSMVLHLSPLPHVDIDKQVCHLSHLHSAVMQTDVQLVSLVLILRL